MIIEQVFQRIVFGFALINKYLTMGTFHKPLGLKVWYDGDNIVCKLFIKYFTYFG